MRICSAPASTVAVMPATSAVGSVVSLRVVEHRGEVVGRIHITGGLAAVGERQRVSDDVTGDHTRARDGIGGTCPG